MDVDRLETIETYMQNVGQHEYLVPDIKWLCAEVRRLRANRDWEIASFTAYIKGLRTQTGAALAAWRAASARAEAAESKLQVIDGIVTRYREATVAAEQHKQALRAALVEASIFVVGHKHCGLKPGVCVNCRVKNQVQEALAATPAPQLAPDATDILLAERGAEREMLAELQEAPQPCPHDWPARDVAGGQRCHGCGEVLADADPVCSLCKGSTWWQPDVPCPKCCPADVPAASAEVALQCLHQFPDTDWYCFLPKGHEGMHKF